MALFEFGKSGFLVKEDYYNDRTGYSNSIDKYGEADLLSAVSANATPQEVIITCKNKAKRVCGFLSEPLQFSAKPEWGEMFGGGIASAGGGAVEILTNLAQYGKGWSVQQPWMNRKMYKKTAPLSFNIKLSFVAESNDESDPLGPRYGVWEPLLALMSFAYPRLLYEKKADGTTTPMLALDAVLPISDETKNKALLVKENMKDSTKGIPPKDAGIVPTAVNLFKAYAIPGPGLRYGMTQGGDENGGDNVSVIIGNYLCFSACYLEDVSINISETMTASGYPLSGDATMKVTVMNGNYVDGLTGEFFLDEIPNRADELTMFLDAVTGGVEKVAEALNNLTNKTASFWGGLPGAVFG